MTALTAGGVVAADMPLKAKAPPPPIVSSWTGWYVGAHFGYGWGETTSDVTTLPSPATFNQVPFSISLDPDGVLGGLQAGYNWQVNRIVFGFEADVSYADINGEGTRGPVVTFFGGIPIAGSFQTNSQKMDWFGTLRARAGFLATDQLLLYATGGAAIGNVKYQSFQSINPVPILQFGASSTQTKVGWTAGGGAEWRISGPWTLKAEYLYYDLGSETLTAARLAPVAFVDTFFVVSSFENRGHIARLGVNYQFR
jgi:outer membrane immunogenic protein